jgi:zinc transport system permease protein
MAIIASALGVLSVLVGLFGAFYLDAPPGPSIVVVATALFLLSYFLPDRNRV